MPDAGEFHFFLFWRRYYSARVVAPRAQEAAIVSGLCRAMVVLVLGGWSSSR